MRALLQSLSRFSKPFSFKAPLIAASRKPFSTKDNGGDSDWESHFGAASGSSDPDPLGWETGASSWSTGITKEHFDGEAIGQMVSESVPDPLSDPNKKIEVENKLKQIVSEMPRLEDSQLLAQVEDPGARSEHLTEWDKDEIYEKHKKDPEVYTVEKLAKEYRIMRQRVHAILWLRELEEEEVEKLGGRDPRDDYVDILIDVFPELFKFHDREFHVATLPYKPDFKVMPEGWDGTTRDPDEVHYEISMKEDQILYEDFVQRMNFNKMKMANMVKCHTYSRRRPSDGWNITVEKLGPKDKRGNGGGRKFVSEGDGSSRPLNEFEKMFVKRETPRRRPKMLP